MFTKCYRNSEYIHSRLINLGQKYWDETILSPQYLGSYWGECPCCPCGVGVPEYPSTARPRAIACVAADPVEMSVVILTDDR